MADKTYLKSKMTILAVLFLLAQLTFAATPRYEIIDLSTQGCGYSTPYAINDIGQVAGFSHDCEGGAFFWDRRNGMIDLGMLPEGGWSVAYGVNDRGQVVGFSGPDDGSAFIWDSENGIRCPDGVGYGNDAYAINNAGQVVIAAEFHSYLWHPDEVVSIVDTLGADRVSACALNNAGQVVGHAYTSHSEYHAFLWDRVTGMRDLGTLGGTRSMAFGINDTGQVVGKSLTTTGDWHAFLWNSDTGMVDLGEGRAHAINNAGQVVGNLSDYGPAFYWDTDNGLIQLSDLLPGYSGWVELESAEAINNRGQIVGRGIIKADSRGHAFLMTPVLPAIYYVDADAAGANDGSSWTDAYNYLQDALTDANSSPKPVEIRVAQGIYTPDSNSAVPDGTGDREATFQLISGVILEGGYAGFGEPDPNEQDFERYETILSGDLNGDDVNVNDPCDLLNEPTRVENSYHVLTGTGTNETSVLDGLTIRGGNANGPSKYSIGGGMFNDWPGGGSTLINCTFIENFAMYGGGGIFMSKGLITGCNIIRNLTGGSGGGLCSCYGNLISNSTIRWNRAGFGGGGLGWCGGEISNCTISRNWAGKQGGGLLGYGGNISNCIINTNCSDHKGGGLYTFGGKISNCIISGNSASDYGGAMYLSYHSPTVTNCTFSGNSASTGRAMFNTSNCRPAVTNCILWDGGDEIENDPGSYVMAKFSNIEGGWPGEGNINAEPLFVDPGYWDANGLWVEGNYHLLTSSLCIDTGDPNYVPEPNETDLDGNPRVIGGRIDMGAYESPIFAEARILPRTINLASKGKSITCYIRLPEGYDVADIDPDSVFLEEQIKAESFSVNEQQQVATAKFIREDVQSILNAGEIELTITGRLTDGTPFEAKDSIRVINKASQKSTHTNCD